MTKEVLISDLGSVVKPQAEANTVRYRDAWNAVPYETDGFTGTLIASLGDGKPKDVEINPSVTGWYRIFVGLPKRNDRIMLRLSADPAFVPFGADRTGDVPGYYDPSIQSNHFFYYDFEEVFWKCADMTGQSVFVSKYQNAATGNALLAWLRFIPMTDEQIDEYLWDQTRNETKRLYCADDMFNMLPYASNKSEWRTVIQNYEQSDTEWLSLEDLFYFDGEVAGGDPDKIAFPGGFRTIQKNHKHYSPEMLTDLVSFGHECGLKMCISRRMGSWEKEFPYDHILFETQIYRQHPEYRCVDRDGTIMTAMSYCYSEVQESVISRFVESAKLGFDAVEMIFSRGVPYVLFEPAFVDRFQSLYGEDPRDLPLDEPRVMALRCEIMTEFTRKLRKRLDEAFPDRRIAIHARGFFSLYENKTIAVDLEAWAREGLIDAIISFPQITREILPAEVFREDMPGHIDLEKYGKLARIKGHDLIYWNQNFRFHDPIPDSNGVLRGPRTQEERIQEYVALEQKYGVRFYAEIMPRHMSSEQFREFAIELYRYGCERFSLWDAYSRVPNRTQWSMVRRLGHKEELHSFTDGGGEYWRVLPIVSIGGQDVSRYMPSFGG